jgi:recombination protein RecT
MDCSALGIEPDNRMAYLIPYGNQCTLIIGYKALVALARRSGEISDIHADIVCANDVFEYSFGSEGKLIHKPKLGDRGEVIAAYSFAKLKDGSSSYEVMDLDEVNAIKNRSKAGKSGPWVSDFAEMAKKTVFRRHSKWLPVSSEKMQEALEKDFDLPSDIVDMSRVGKPVVSEPKAIAAEPASASGELSEDEKAEIRKADADLKKRQEAAKQSREPGED